MSTDECALRVTNAEGLTRNHKQDKLIRISRWAVLAVLFFSPWRLEAPIILPGFDPVNVPFAAYVPRMRPADALALVAIVTYAWAGWPNRRRLLAPNARVWSMSLAGLVTWAALSVAWAAHRGLGVAFTVRLALWVLLALRVMCDSLPPRAIALSLFAGLMLNAVIGIGQVLAQGNLGLAALGELPIGLSYPGVSVIGPDDAHLIRLYGLSAHPNVMGGYAAVALLLASGLVVARSLRRRWMLPAWAIGWLALLLSFSRSALLGFLVGGAVTAIILIKGRLIDLRRSMPIVVTLLAGGLALLAVLGPVVIERVIVSESTVEQISIQERVDLSATAASIIAAHPITGVGIGNFRLASHDWTSPPVYTDWVHNIPLLVASELGLVGLALGLAGVAAIIGEGIARWRDAQLDAWSALAAGAIIALLVIMQFDHYLWTSSQGTYVWGGLTGWWIGRQGSYHALHVS